jgi:hypothetical protein
MGACERARMPSQWGAQHGDLRCSVCGLRYDNMRTGLTFAEVRRLIISIGFCTKMGHVKNGRRNGVLGYMHELKLQFWDQHVGVCESSNRIPKTERTAPLAQGDWT